MPNQYCRHFKAVRWFIYMLSSVVSLKNKEFGDVHKNIKIFSQNKKRHFYRIISICGNDPYYIAIEQLTFGIDDNLVRLSRRFLSRFYQIWQVLIHLHKIISLFLISYHFHIHQSSIYRFKWNYHSLVSY